MSRTYRQKKTGGKAVATSCRNHGDCPWCQGNRRYNEKRDLEKAEYEEKEFKNNRQSR